MQSFNRPAAPPSIPQGSPIVPTTRPADRTKSYAQQQQQQQQQPVQPDAPGDPISAAAKNMPLDKKAGDYTAQISKFAGSFARWTSLPVKVHVPMNTPENWKLPLDTAVRKWSQYLPTVIAPAQEQADIEIGWINHLAPRQLGITNLEIFNGRPRVTVYLLRPNYYPPDISERKLEQVAIHELGHALGLFGHSSNPADIMFSLDASSKTGALKGSGISPRDINTLQRIYSSAALPEGFQSPQPISFPCLDSRTK